MIIEMKRIFKNFKISMFMVIWSLKFIFIVGLLE